MNVYPAQAFWIEDVEQSWEIDYLKVGTPLTVILLVLMTLLVPVFFPL